MRAWLEGFANGIPSTWTRVGTWTSSNGDAIVTSTTGISWLGPPVTPTPKSTVSAVVVADTLGDITALRAIGVANPHSSTANDGISCTLLLYNNATERRTVLSNINAGSMGEGLFTWTEGMPYYVAVRRDLTMYQCLARDLTSMTTTDRTGSVSIAPTQPIVVFRTRNIAGRAHWLMYVTSP